MSPGRQPGAVEASPVADQRFSASPLLAGAIEFARGVYEGQVRSASGGMPYVEHPVAVAKLVESHGYSDVVVAAALLHDVLEDSGATPTLIGERFGIRVKVLVEQLSDDESVEAFERRKDEHRRRIETAGPDALAIYAADKLTNVRTLRRAYAESGETVGEELSAPLDAKLDAWARDVSMLRRRAPDLPFLEDLSNALSGLREDRAVSAPGNRRPV